MEAKAKVQRLLADLTDALRIEVLRVEALTRSPPLPLLRLLLRLLRLVVRLLHGLLILASPRRPVPRPRALRHAHGEDRS